MEHRGESEWELAHRELLRLAAVRAAHEHTLCGALLRARRTGAWRAMGMASFHEYAGRVVGLSPRQTEERLRVALALEHLPLTSATLGAGGLHYSAVRELTRVVVPNTESEWLTAVEGKSVSEIQELVAGRRPGDHPGDPPKAEARRHTIILEVSAETYATYREAQAKVRRDTDAKLTEEEGLLLMARAVLGGPTDPGRSPFQIRMSVCASCGDATQDARGRGVQVEASVAEAAACDAQRVDGEGRATQDVPPKLRRIVMARQRGTCAVPGCRNAVFTEVHHVRPRSEGGPHALDNLIVLCAVHHGAVHRGTLRVRGSWSKGLRFNHADGRPYGDVRSAMGMMEPASRLGGADEWGRMDGVSPHVGASIAP